VPKLEFLSDLQWEIEWAQKRVLKLELLSDLQWEIEWGRKRVLKLELLSGPRRERASEH
jgi:hypothetical protein